MDSNSTHSHGPLRDLSNLCEWSANILELAMDRQNCVARVRIWFEASEQKTYKRFRIPQLSSKNNARVKKLNE